MDQDLWTGPGWAEKRNCSRLALRDGDLHIELAGDLERIQVQDLSLDGLRGRWATTSAEAGLAGEHRLFRQRELLMRCRLRPIQFGGQGLIRARLSPVAPRESARLAHFLALRFADQALRCSEQRHAWLEELGASSRDWVKQTLVHFVLKLQRPIKVFLDGQALPPLLQARGLDTVAGRQVLLCELKGGSLRGLA